MKLMVSSFVRGTPLLCQQIDDLCPYHEITSIMDPAFATSTQVNSPTARVKGRETYSLHLTIATPTSTQAKPTSPRPTAKTSTIKKKQTSTMKGKKSVFAKNSPKKIINKRSNSSNTKTFKPLKDLR